MSGTTHGDSLPDGKGAWRRFDSAKSEHYSQKLWLTKTEAGDDQ
tara:strand:- start:54 stop:185 length:132 start_codon:yes stop_codon:yes gene_type:complete